jgi:hypothetical protein
MSALRKSVLQSGVVYLGDNGRATCSACSGHSARHTGRDLSGQKVTAMNADDLRDLEIESLSCECGLTKVTAA